MSDIKTWLTVRVEEGGLPQVQVVAQKPYLDRTATGMATVPEGDPAYLALVDALADIQERYRGQAVYQAEVSAARSLVAAVDKREV